MFRFMWLIAELHQLSASF